MTSNSESEAENPTEQATKTSINDSEHENSTATLRADYEQTNQQINVLADIRFKLLALVPTLTAAAVSLLTSDKGKVAPGTILAVGLLGFFAVFALAMYDLRNSQIYDAWIVRAKQLEKQLHMPSTRGEQYGGLWSERPGRLVRLFGIKVWHDQALDIIYGTALGGWFYIITYSLISLLSPVFPWSKSPLFTFDLTYPVSILIAALIAYAFIRQFQQIEASRSESRTKLIVNNVSDPDTSENLRLKKGDRFKCISVNVCLRNVSKHQLKYNVSELELQDNQDRRKYKYAGTDGKHRLTKTLKPGELTQLVLVYKIPENHTPAKLIYTPRLRFLNLNWQQIIGLAEDPTVDIVLIRHGDRDHSYSAVNYSPLTQDGKDKVDRLKDRLVWLNFDPEVYLTSKHEHACETAKRLSVGGTNLVYLDTLTPPDSRTETNIDTTQENSFEAIISEAKQAGVELSQKATIAIVGHEEKPELFQILKCLTSCPVRPLNRAEAVWLRADSFSDFCHGKGVVQAWISGEKGAFGSTRVRVPTGSTNSEQSE